VVAFSLSQVEVTNSLVREKRRDNREWEIQRHSEHWAQDTERRQTKQTTQHKKQ
jgi:hypothetical protein